MPLRYSEFGVFDVPVQVLVNTINCKGVMGAGLALEFRLRYPSMFRDYKSRVEMGLKPGRPYLYNKSDPWTLNFPTKYHWANPSRLQWVEDGLRWFAENYRIMGINSIAFPQLGCGQGRLQWTDVQPVMEHYLRPLPIEVYICLDLRLDPNGEEAGMLRSLHSADIDCLQRIGLNNATANRVLQGMPFERFRQVREVEGVGLKSYEKLHRYFYNEVKRMRQMAFPWF